MKIGNIRISDKTPSLWECQQKVAASHKKDLINQEKRIRKILKKLLPCPLCGKKEEDGHQTLFFYWKPFNFVIKCNLCGLRIEQDREGKVIGIWNTRNGISKITG